MELPELKYYSQALQDKFAVMMLKYKKCGKFLEIGANDARHNSNTYTLEQQLGWSGLMVEYDSRYAASHRTYRPNSISIINDARTVDYVKILSDNNFPLMMDYLSIDIDVNNRSTLDTLELLDKTIFDKYIFGTVTFEHDIYTGNFYDTQQISRDIFDRRGYIRIFTNVSVWYTNPLKGGKMEWCPFEDWYVHPAIVDQSLIQSILSDPDNNKENMTFEQCIAIITKY